ncbi:unnamed protein product, partial [Mesorhabditis spiculigera]
MPDRLRCITFRTVRKPPTLWYHDHAMGITRLNVYAGLIGNYLIRMNSTPANWEIRWGCRPRNLEIPLILQEKIFTPTGAQNGRIHHLDPGRIVEGGAVGDVGLVNGQVRPELFRLGPQRFLHRQCVVGKCVESSLLEHDDVLGHRQRRRNA